MTSLQSAARLLGGEASADRILCPGPGHKPHDRSLSVRFSDDAPDGFVVTSFANDDWQECKDHVRRILGLGAFAPREGREHCNLGPVRVARRPATPSPEQAEKQVRAGDIWRAAVPTGGTPAETYLASRGLSYEGEALRWHPSCPFGPRVRVGCMVALVSDIVTNSPLGIHRTAIDNQGRKLSHLGANGRLALGPTGGGAVKLTNDAEVTDIVGVGEGIESVLSLRRLPGCETLPVWALLNAGQVAAFPALAAITAVWFALDHDPAGIKAVGEAAERLAHHDIESIIVAPVTAGVDLNDKVQTHAQA